MLTTRGWIIGIELIAVFLLVLYVSTFKKGE